MVRLAVVFPYELVFSRTSPQILYGAGFSNGITFFMSADGGATWAARSVGVPGVGRALALDPRDERIVYIGGEKRDKDFVFRAFIAKSSDGGQKWTYVTGKVQGTTIHAIAIDPEAPNRVLAGSDVGVFRSEDSGASWTRVLSADVYCLKFAASSPKAVYAGSASGLYLSLDGGQTWTESVAGMTVKFVQSLAADAAQKTIYAGTYGGSVLQIVR